MTTPSPVKEMGSMRDPEGRVIRYQNRIFRGVSKEYTDILSLLNQSGLLRQFETSHKVIPTDQKLDDPSLLKTLKEACPNFSKFVEHEPIPFVVYPCEWTFSMLCDAALLHLDIQTESLKKGISLKDASAYNVQFKGSREIFIDITSFEKIISSVWPAYGQFCRMFLFPLLLSTYRGISTKSYFLSHMDGISLAETARILGWLRILTPACFLDVFLPSLLEKGVPHAKKLEKVGPNQNRDISIKSQLMNLNRLRNLIDKLRRKGSSLKGHWIDYTQTHSYSSKEMEDKENFVTAFLQSEKPKTLIDLGSNTGKFSLLASSICQSVISIDSDHDALDALYEKSRSEGLNIIPLWMDLANPTPAFGFNNQERSKFGDRIKGETVLGLAVVHHLLVSFGIPLPLIRDFLWSLSSKFLLVEFVGPKDPQFRSLIGFKNVSYENFTEAQFESVFSRGAIQRKKLAITPHRTLFLFSKSQ